MEALRGNEPSIPGYKLLGRLGSGGFGTVYAAEDASGKQVAIKVLRPELSDDEELLNRLEREATALQQVTGSHTAKIHEVSTRGEHAYLVMDLIEGRNLEQHVRENGPLKSFELRVVVEELVVALREIHQVGVVHRDLKPSNVMYGPAGVTLLDFGISAIADSTALTKTGAFIGTAGWISPEQIEGRPVSTPTDVFNLGLVIAYVATGQHPFGTGRPEGIMYRICHQEPRLSSVPSPIQEIVHECLTKDENARVEIIEIHRRLTSESRPSGEGTQNHGLVLPARQVEKTRLIHPRKFGSEENPRQPQKSPRPLIRRGLVSLVTLITLSLIAFVIALAVPRSKTNEVAPPTPSSLASNGTEAPSSSLQEPPETDLSEITDAPPSSTEIVRTSSTLVLPTTSETIQQPPNRAPSVASTITIAPAPPASQPAQVVNSDGPPAWGGFKTTTLSTGNNERFEITFELRDQEGVASASVLVRRSNNSVVSRCKNQTAVLLSGTSKSGLWKANCLLDDDQPSGDYSRYYFIEQCSEDNLGAKQCSPMGSYKSTYSSGSFSSSTVASSPLLENTYVLPERAFPNELFAINFQIRNFENVSSVRVDFRSQSGKAFSCSGTPTLGIIEGKVSNWSAKCLIPNNQETDSVTSTCYAYESWITIVMRSGEEKRQRSLGICVAADGNPPEVVSSSSSINQVSSGGSVRFDVRVRDTTGTRAVYIRWYQCADSVLISGTKRDGVWSVTCSAPINETGTDNWGGTLIWYPCTEDELGNYLCYTGQGGGIKLNP